MPPVKPRGPQFQRTRCQAAQSTDQRALASVLLRCMHCRMQHACCQLIHLEASEVPILPQAGLYIICTGIGSCLHHLPSTSHVWTGSLPGAPTAGLGAGKRMTCCC